MATTLIMAWEMLAGQSIAAPQPAIEYIFVADTDRRVGFTDFLVVRIGRFDNRGEFHELERDDLSRGGSVRMRLVGSEWVPEHLTGPYERVKRRGPAFEYHNGQLIRGVVDRHGAFVPEPKTRLVRIEDYKPGADALPIWNLPGYFMRRDKLEERRKWLADHMVEDPDYAKEKAKLDAALKGE